MIRCLFKLMSSFVYLIRNGDLFIIGSSNNIERSLSSYKPEELLASLESNSPDLLLRNLRRAYVDCRLPGSDYYRLSNSQVNECRNILEQDVKINYFKPFFTGYRLFFVFVFSWLLITFIIIQFAINPILGRFS